MYFTLDKGMGHQKNILLEREEGEPDYKQFLTNEGGWEHYSRRGMMGKLLT